MVSNTSVSFFLFKQLLPRLWIHPVRYTNQYCSWTLTAFLTAGIRVLMWSDKRITFYIGSINYASWTVTIDCFIILRQVQLVAQNDLNFARCEHIYICFFVQSLFFHIFFFYETTDVRTLVPNQADFSFCLSVDYNAPMSCWHETHVRHNI